MMVAEASTRVRASADAVRASVYDPIAYTRGTKVAQIEVLERGEDGMLARIHGRFGPVRSSILARYRDNGSEVDLTMISGRLRGFHAVFRIDADGDGVRLTHREEYDFGYGPLTPVVERLLRGWATRSVEAEVDALRQDAEARVGAAA
jgi:hypothetical protein